MKDNASGSREWVLGEIIADQYELEKQLGVGGVSFVYKAYDRLRKMPVAIRVPRAAILLDTKTADMSKENLNLWESLPSHPNIIKCFGTEILLERPCQIMELVEGGSLQDWINQRKLQNLSQVLDIAIQVAEGLSALHKAEILHLNIKPHVILLTNKGECKLVGFVGAKRCPVGSFVSSEIFTPSFCSPEPAEKLPVSHRSDMWSWGLSVFEMFTGEVTWVHGQIAKEALEHYLETKDKNQAALKMPNTLADLLRRCFQRKPEKRLDTMDDILYDLHRIAKENSMVTRHLSFSNETVITKQNNPSASRKWTSQNAHTILRNILKESPTLSLDKVMPNIPGYTIEKELRPRSATALYIARRNKDNRKVIIKTMHGQRATNTLEKKLFHGEIRLGRSLFRHPNAVEYIDQGQINETPYCVMEYCNGGNLDDLLKQRGGKLSLKEAVSIILQILQGLSYIHQKGIIHRDIQPNNVLLHREANILTVKITGFKFARSLEIAHDEDVFWKHAERERLHEIIRFSRFWAREQARDFIYAKPVSDVWSVGSIFYNMLTNNFPFDFENNRTPLEIVLKEKVVPIQTRDPEIPPEIAKVIGQALQDDTKQRYQNGADMLRAMEEAIVSLAFSHFRSEISSDILAKSSPRLSKAAELPQSSTSVRCQKCGKDICNEAKRVQQKDYYCRSCLAQAKNDPVVLVRQNSKIKQKVNPARLSVSGQKLRRLPQCIADYEIIQELGQDSMGTVFLGRRKADDMLVAIKVFIPNGTVMFFHDVRTTQPIARLFFLILIAR